MRKFTSHKAEKAEGVKPLSPQVATERASGAAASRPKSAAETKRPKEIGGPEGPEPTRFGDWERKGICYDF